MAIEGLPATLEPDSQLTLEFKLANWVNWAPAGHLVATGQIQLQKPLSLSSLCKLGILPETRPTISLVTPMTLSVTSSSGSEWKFNLASGAMHSWIRPERPYFNILSEPLQFDLYRACTDNDRGCDFGRNWVDRRLHQAKNHLVQVSWSHNDVEGTAEVVVKGRVAPPVLDWALETTTTFRFAGNGSVVIHVHAHPTGHRLPRAWARLGLVTALQDCQRVGWWGRGPGESYRDKKQSQLVGSWETDVAHGCFTDYEFPQENGNRTDVRWVEFRDGTGQRLLRARYGDFEGASFGAQRYTDADLEAAQHPYELYERKRADTVVHLDWMHHGLGTGSCGPETLPAHTLDASLDYDVSVLLD